MLTVNSQAGSPEMRLMSSNMHQRSCLTAVAPIASDVVCGCGADPGRVWG